MERKHRTLVVGLTGGIASGKSTAAQYFRKLGVPVIDADEIAREVVEPDQPALKQLTALFGPDMLDANGRLDRARLRHLIFADAGKRRQVEGILHPAIRQTMLERLAHAQGDYCILSIPLLLETRQTDLVNRVLVIDSPEALQRDRLSKREGWTSEEIGAAIAAQLSRQERLQNADDVIVNDGDLASFERAVEQMHRRYRLLASAHDSATP